jgi:putative methyltransferase (TIGR04325 family)
MTTVTEIFPNFTAARAKCASGYDDDLIAEVMAFKTSLTFANGVVPEQALNSIVAVAMAAAETSSQPLCVLDLGGACGFHYLWVAAALRIPLRWAIVETPTMAAHATKIASGRFGVFTELTEAARWLGRIDLIHASGVLQYVPDPIASLQALAALGSPYIALARFPIWNKAAIVAMQNSFLAENGIGPLPPGMPDKQIRFPITFVNFADISRALSQYTLALETDSPTGTYNFRGVHVPGRSLIFRRTPAPQAL